MSERHLEPKWKLFGHGMEGWDSALLSQFSAFKAHIAGNDQLLQSKCGK